MGAPEPKWDIFISYAAVDREWAEWIAWQVEDAGYQVLLQAWDFVPGSHWTTRMGEGTTNTGRTLAILSSAYLESVYGRAEWEAAYRADPQGLRRKLIPIRVEECDRPGLLGGIVSIDVFDCAEDVARRRLLDAILEAEAGRAKPATPPGFPGRGAPAASPLKLRLIPPRMPPPATAPRFPRRALPVAGLLAASALVGGVVHLWVKAGREVEREINRGVRRDNLILGVAATVMVAGLVLLYFLV